MSHPPSSLSQSTASGLRHQSGGQGDVMESFERDFGNIFEEDEMESTVQSPAGKEPHYFCIFCDSKQFPDRNDVKRHYQRHLEYYPILCSLCGSRETDLNDFLQHHTSCHPGVGKGKYKRREEPHVDRWLNGFIYAQSTILSAFPARDHCPVCEKIFSLEQIAASRSRKSTVNRKIDHLHRHLCYLPYECLRCRSEGKEFLVAYFESKAHNHIIQQHPELAGQESRSFVFQKSIAIPKLDDFISDFLMECGISINNIEKQSVQTHSVSSLDNILSADFDGEESDENVQQPSGDVDPEDSHESNQTSDKCFVVPVSPDIISPENNTSQSGWCPSVGHFSCIFCPEKLYNQAHAHLSSHFDYHPVHCLLCEQQFDDIEKFSAHHKSCHPDQPDLKFEVREDFVIEKWIDDFLKFQCSQTMNKLLLRCSCASCCPSCSSITTQTIELVPCSSHSESYFSDHVKNHLNYLPFSCVVCKELGKVVRLPSLEVMGISHTRREHSDLRLDLLSRPARLFTRTYTIPVIEELISQSILKRHSLNTPVTSSYGKHHRIHIPAAIFNRSDAPVNQTSNNKRNDAMTSMRVIFEGNRFVLKQFPRKSSVKAIPQPQTSSPHIRIEGGRVVNLPEMRGRNSSHQITRINLNSPHHQLQRSSPSSILSNPVPKAHSSGLPKVSLVRQQLEKPVQQTPSRHSIITSSALAAVPVTCHHCKQTYPSKRLLRIHSNNMHPGLQVAFTPASVTLSRT